MNPKASRFVGGIALAAAYFCAGKLGLLMADLGLHSSVSPIWPAAGIAVAALLLRGYGLWPGVFIGAFLANVMVPFPDDPPLVIRITQASGIAAGATLEALAGAWLANRFANGSKAFLRVGDVFRYAFFTGVVSTAASATIGITTLLLCGLLQGSASGSAWLTWCMGDMVGAIVVAPLILIWRADPSLRFGLKRTLEALGLLASVILISRVIFSDAVSLGSKHYPLEFLLVPLLVWAALRFESRGVVALVFIVSCIAIDGTWHGLGPFAVTNQNGALLLLQTFICVATVTALALAAAVAERKNAEAASLESSERLRLALSISGMGIWSRELTGERRGRWSPQAETLFGFKPGEADAAEETFYNLIHPGDRARVRQALEDAIKVRAENVEVEYRFYRNGGGTGWMLSRGRIFYDKNDQPLQLTGVVIDLTVRREMEEALRESEERFRRLNSELEQRVQERTARLEAANRELEAFCYSVSHDLRAPLRTVRGFSEVLLEQYTPQLDARGRDFLRRTCEAGAQMDRLIEDLLKLSRVSRNEMQSGDIDLSALAREIASELKQGEPARTVELTIAPGLQAKGDERLLRLVLDNLLRNAWKFTGKLKNAHIEFGRQNGDTASFFVRDDGAGFDMAYAGKLFGVFQRLHSASEFSGSGVGLAIVQRIINRHGGRVWAEAKVNAGATFYFTLPSANGSLPKQMEPLQALS